MKRQEIISDRRGEEQEPPRKREQPSSVNRQTLVVGNLIGPIIVALGYTLMRRGPENAVDHPEAFHYVCRNPACKHEFTLTAAEFNDWVGKHPGEYIKCPKC